MGGQLVKKAFTAAFLASQRGAPLTSNERSILLYMASVVRDDDAEPRFWGGRENLASIALCRPIPRGDDAAKARDSIFKSVSIAIRGLARRGLITRVSMGFEGHAAEYTLLVDKWVPIPLIEEASGNLRFPLPGTSDSTSGNATFPLRESEVPPKDQQNNKKTRGGTHGSPKATTSLAPVDNSKGTAA